MSNKYKIFYMNSRVLVKILCAREAINYEKAAKVLAEKTGKHYTKASLNNKIHKDTLRFTEAYVLADALGYDLTLVKRK